MLENYEDDITEWYFKYREQDLLDWLCKHRVLKSEEQGTHSEMNTGLKITITTTNSDD